MLDPGSLALGLLTLADSNKEIVFITMGTVGLVWILSATFSGVLKTRARERSRREIAAYIAEGSMTPEQGERLMRAGMEEDECSCG